MNTLGCDQAQQFLDALFGGKPDGEYILIWLLHGKRSAWFTDTAQAAAFVQANSSRDVYVGVATSPKDHGPHQRLKVEGGTRMPSSIVALWGDIDIMDGQPRNKVRAPDEAVARSIFFPDLPPSILVRSGGGLHAWWLFREPWTLESEEEVRKAGALAVQWNRALQARAAIRKFDVDSVGDLTRVLRVPGTMNCKIPGQPRSVRLVEINDRRYNPSDIDEYLDTIGAAKTTVVIPPAASTAGATGLIYETNVEPPFNKFHAFCENETKFRLSWNHKRRDLKDQSVSAYDMSLANMAVQASWTDQEIANLLIAHRRKYSADLKLRDSYYAKSIAKARASQTLQ